MKIRAEQLRFVKLVFLLTSLSLTVLSCGDSDTPKERALKLANTLIGHWISEDGRNHLYFSRENMGESTDLLRMNEISDGEQGRNSICQIAWLEGEVAKNSKDFVLLEFVGYGNTSIQVTFVGDGKTILVDEPITLKPVGSQGRFKYVDNLQGP